MTLAGEAGQYLGSQLQITTGWRLRGLRPLRSNRREPGRRWLGTGGFEGFTAGEVVERRFASL
jgi:hypothetical protein